MGWSKSEKVPKKAELRGIVEGLAVSARLLEAVQAPVDPVVPEFGYPAAFPLCSINTKPVLKVLTSFMSTFGVPKVVQTVISCLILFPKW